MLRKIIIIAFAGLLLSACGARPDSVQTMAGAAPAIVADPLEPINRKMFSLNRGLTKTVIRPLVTVYRAVLPKPLRRAVSNVAATAKLPLTTGHALLQGDGDQAFTALGRLLVNATVGVGGTMDVASRWGIADVDEDAGQTLGVWGVPSGPYLVLPLLGPSSIRDGIGFGADIFADPMRYVLRGDQTRRDIGSASFGINMAALLDENIDRQEELERGAVDPYVAMREAYTRYRAAAVRNDAGGPPADDPLADELGPP
jgi:phospholipid-binding lipoprotein MlaA